MSNPLILWDFDGTLADTLGIALETYNQLAAEYGFRPVDDPQSVRDHTMRQFLKSYRIPAWRVPGLSTRFLKAMKSANASIKLFPGIVDVVRNLKQAGFRNGIVSSNSTANIQQCLNHNSADDLFDAVCGTSLLFGKERHIRTSMKQFGVAASECLYIGDEVRDVEAARASGVPAGCVGWGLNSPRILREQSPVFVADTTQDLSELIHRHFTSADH